VPGRARGRAAYYSTLLVNVGCHTDAYEQVQWFGDDIALKAMKYAEAAGVGPSISNRWSVIRKMS
jgi:hypothetical protein